MNAGKSQMGMDDGVPKLSRICVAVSVDGISSVAWVVAPSSAFDPVPSGQLLAFVAVHDPLLNLARAASIRRVGPWSAVKVMNVTPVNTVPSRLVLSARITVCPAALPWRSQSPDAPSVRTELSPRSASPRASNSRDVLATIGFRIATAKIPMVSATSRGEISARKADRPAARVTTISDDRASPRNNAIVARIMISGRMR